MALEAVALGSALGSPGALLRAWRTELGWTQDDVARTVRVSRAAVTSWETDARRMPAQALADLDFAFVAGGCLAGLVRAAGAPRGSRDGAWLAGPRRQWGHVFAGEPGPAWAWARPAAGDRVAGYAQTGLLRMPFDEVTGPDGIFLTTPYVSPRLPLRVTLNEPGWVDFGRGTIPSWLDRPSKTSAGLADAEVAGHPALEYFAREFRNRDRGAPETLRDRLRALADPDRWDRLERHVRAAGWEEPPGDSCLDAATGHRPPETAEARAALHRRLREARGMSQAAAAAAVSALLAGSSGPGEARVTRQQVRNYEEGRASRVRHLPALLDMAYDAFGWSCWEPVRVRRTGAREFEAVFPGWWTGPVGVTAVPAAAFPSPGSLTLISRDRRSDCPLPGAGGRVPVTAEHLRLPGEPALLVRVPPGWHPRAHMGHRAGAIDADAAWRPADAAAAGRLFELTVQTWLRLLGRTQADLDRALRIEPPATHSWLLAATSLAISAYVSFRRINVGYSFIFVGSYRGDSSGFRNGVPLYVPRTVSTAARVRRQPDRAPGPQARPAQHAPVGRLGPGGRGHRRLGGGRGLLGEPGDLG